MQPTLGRDRSWKIVLVALIMLALGSVVLLGFAICAGVNELNSEPTRWQALETAPLPEDLDFPALWEGAGFYLVQQEKDYLIQRQALDDGGVFWLQEQIKWVLAPQQFGENLAAVLLELGRAFLDAGWSIVLDGDEEGYTLSLWESLPKIEQKVLTRIWHLEALTPKNHSSYRLGCIPVSGELFDPLAARRGTPEAPVLAIVIDDWGYASPANDALLAFPFPLTVAVLPQALLSREISAEADLAGHEVILHQPMEALDGSLELGPGGITSEMTAEEAIAQIVDNLRSVPCAAGMNNHMGSRITADAVMMEEILAAIRAEGLFFVDSRTSPQTVGPAIAEMLGVAYGVNDLFLDNENEVAEIKEQIRKGLALAARRGQAIVIGHVRPATAQALWEMIPEFLDSRVQLVPVSQTLIKP